MQRVNEQCLKCKHECKQWLVNKIIKCPLFKRKGVSDEPFNKLQRKDS